MTTYWNEVCRVLREDYKLGRLEAANSVRCYRSVLRKQGIRDIVYHDLPCETARGIVNGEYVVTGSSCVLFLIFVFLPVLLLSVLPERWLTPKALSIIAVVCGILGLGLTVGLLHYWFVFILLFGLCCGLGYLANISRR